MTAEQLQGWLARAIGAVFREALAIAEPAGGSPAWARICHEHGVPPISEQARAEVRAAQRPMRGAPVMELAQVVTAIVGAGRAHLGRIAAAGPDARSGELRRLLERADREVIEAYKRAVLPRRAGMFANVLAHHDASRRASLGAPAADALLCQTCGGPRLGERDLDCAFCGNHMAAVP